MSTPFIFSWEPALWLLNWHDRVWLLRSKKSIAIFGYKQWLLSIDMKTKVFQHFSRIIFNVFKILKFSSCFQVFKVFRFPAPVWLSDIFNWHFFVVTLYHCILKENLCCSFRRIFDINHLLNWIFVKNPIYAWKGHPYGHIYRSCNCVMF